MSLETRLARFAVRHPYRMLATAIVLALVCVGVIAARARLDTDVLNLLPQKFDSVRALKVFDRDFSQAHEVTFGLLDAEQKTDLDAFADYFGEELRKEPWVVRVMDRSPVESPEGVNELQTLAIPLLLNIPPEEFPKVLEKLEPNAISERFARKKAEIEAGSPKAEMELMFDPLGVVVPALKPLRQSFSMDGPRPLASPDGTLRVAIAVTNQEKLDAYSCQEMMRKVEAFTRRVRDGWEGPAPEILATGRTAYVAEMSGGMKHDVIVTIFGSIALVSGVFYLGFRRLRPLLAIFLVITLCCLAAVATGVALFESLNVITIGICAILVGLAVDFGMLLFGTYQAERSHGVGHEEAAVRAVAKIGRGILFGAATCGTAFLSLLLSESPGFMQLGVLIGVGILIAAVFMIVFFFVFTGERHRPLRRDFLLEGTRAYLERLLRAPKPIFLTGAALLLALNLYAWLPVGTLRFDADPKSLEPADSKAGYALRTITSKIPAAESEPVLAIVEAKNAADFHTQWARAEEHWLAVKERGAVKNLASPAAYAVDPARVKANTGPLARVDFARARQSFREALEREGFDSNAFQGAFALLDALEKVGHGNLAPLNWRSALPARSSWLFILDRFLSPTPGVGVAYITPNHTIKNADEQRQLRHELQTRGVHARLTGWSYVMADLLPWSKSKLTELSLLMVIFITVILFLIYRSVAPLFILLLSLGLSVGALVAGLKITGVPLNLFNVLAFPLILGIGVDYGIYTILAVRQGGGSDGLASVVKPIFLSGLTTIAGFGSLGFANNPALATLGLICALGVSCCLFSTLFFVLPAYLWRGYR